MTAVVPSAVMVRSENAVYAGQCAEIDHVFAVREVADRVGSVTCLEHERVGAGAAGQRIVPAPTGQPVGMVTTIEGVGAGIAVEPVVAPSAAQVVVARAAEERVPVRTAVDRVVAATSAEHVEGIGRPSRNRRYRPLFCSLLSSSLGFRRQQREDSRRLQPSPFRKYPGSRTHLCPYRYPAGIADRWVVSPIPHRPPLPYRAP